MFAGGLFRRKKKMDTEVSSQGAGDGGEMDVDMRGEIDVVSGFLVFSFESALYQVYFSFIVSFPSSLNPSYIPLSLSPLPLPSLTSHPRMQPTPPTKNPPTPKPTAHPMPLQASAPSPPPPHATATKTGAATTPGATAPTTRPTTKARNPTS